MSVISSKNDKKRVMSVAAPLRKQINAAIDNLTEADESIMKVLLTK
jgi:hypothetical protein